MRVVVTGGSGFIGRFAADALVANGAEVHLLGRTDPGRSDGARFHGVDLLDAAATAAAIAAIQPSHLI